MHVVGGADPDGTRDRYFSAIMFTAEAASKETCKRVSALIIAFGSRFISSSLNFHLDSIEHFSVNDGFMAIFHAVHGQFALVVERPFCKMVFTVLSLQEQAACICWVSQYTVKAMSAPILAHAGRDAIFI